MPVELLNLQPLAAADFIVPAGLLIVAADFVVAAAVGCGDAVEEQPAALQLLAHYVLLRLVDCVLLLADCVLLLADCVLLLLLADGMSAAGADESVMLRYWRW